MLARKSMKASMDSSVLIEQVVYLASKGREATDQDPIFDMPKGRSKAKSCPIQRALNLNCTVGAGSITFQSPEHAAKIASACGLDWQKGSTTATIPVGHPFNAFVTRFDGGRDKQLLKLRLA
jgi:hypothetical protein